MGIFVVLLGASFVLRYGALAASDNQEYIAEIPTDQPLGAESSFTLQPETGIRQYNDLPSYGTGYRPYPSNDKKKCPLCDSSIYPYCSEKLLHDACCCTNPYIHDLPYQCKLADCRFLHAKSCREFRLIANCCCSDDYRSLLKSFTKDSSSSSSLSNERQGKLTGNI
ncbi:hypothetical protein KPH14_012485 [Odynerus spinipes]|uniref:CCC domain-containing protein n=1 Tax=Odynerus spinipes TaxID=1348599 RepID=A0AAD9RI76_9HYME|nr:hypothetical protein KPH14_012485 [Odynerus spinipes]